MTTRQAHQATYRHLAKSTRPLDSARISNLLTAEWDRYRTSTLGSMMEFNSAVEVIPLGVTSSFQHWDPYPISIASAKGAWMKDVDGRDLLDLSMGFGAMLAGHLNPVVVQELTSALEVGTLFVTPSPISSDAAARICKRFGLDQVRFANSGTEATMYAVRTARAFSGKDAIVKVEGGYHGSYDPLTVSAKPALNLAGPADNPNVVVPPATLPGPTFIVPYNNLDALERTFRDHAAEIACFIVEPVLENIGIVLPDEGYLEGVRALCDKYGIILIFDEVKTGLTAGAQGAAQRLKVQPDLITIAKSIGGGVPLAAFGGKREYMQPVTDGRCRTSAPSTATRSRWQAFGRSTRSAPTKPLVRRRVSTCRHSIALQTSSMNSNCPHTLLDSVSRVASLGPLIRCAITATTRPPTSRSQSFRGSGR